MKLLLTMFCYMLLAVTPTSLFAGDGHDHEDTSNRSEEAQHDDSDKDHNEGGKHDEHEGHEGEEKFVEMTPEELIEFGIELKIAAPGTIRNEIIVPGEIAVNGNNVAHITPRFTGMITEVRVNIGDKVKQGEILAVVESNESLTTYEVRSLIDGMVINRHATIGEVLSNDQPAFLIANLDTIWVNLSIYQMHLSRVRLGQQVTIALGHGQESQVGTISYISPIVDEHTRTATARVVLDNYSGNWRPGLLIEGIITTATSKASIVIPKTAIQRIDETDVVFVKTEKGYAPQPVVLGRTNHTSAEVKKGMVVGQEYVSKGGFTLKSELQKGSFGEGHSH